MEFSAAHLSAFRAYQARGHRLDGLTLAQLDALDEDREFLRETAAYRRRIRAAEAATAPATPAREAAPLNAWRALTPMAEDTDIDVWLTTNGTRAAPLGVVQVLIKWLSGLQATVKEQGARIKEQDVLLKEQGARVAELEQRGPSMKYCGPWLDAPDGYALGDVVSRQGSMWHSDVHHNKTIPGCGGSQWTLCVKHGKDGR